MFGMNQATDSRFYLLKSQMTSIFTGSPTYLSATDVKDTTTDANLILQTNAFIERLIFEAERIVDNFIGAYGIKKVDTQLTIFPTRDDWLPQEIKEATFYLVEALFVYGNQIVNMWNQVVGETVWDHSVKYSEQEKIDSIDDFIPLKAKKILQMYGGQFYQPVLHQKNAQDVQWVFVGSL